MAAVLVPPTLDPSIILTNVGAGQPFSIADVYALQQACRLVRGPGRARPSGQRPLINKMRQFDTACGSSYWTNLGRGAPETVLGMRLAEASGI